MKPGTPPPSLARFWEVLIQLVIPAIGSGVLNGSFDPKPGVQDTEHIDFVYDPATDLLRIFAFSESSASYVPGVSSPALWGIEVPTFGRTIAGIAQNLSAGIVANKGMPSMPSFPPPPSEDRGFRNNNRKMGFGRG